MSKFTLISISFGEHKPFNCAYPHETLIVKTKGWGKARCVAMANAHYEFVVMVNADVEMKPEAWRFILSCKQGEFMMVREGELPCTRIFAIHKGDYEKVGFDPSLKYIFEDGDFHVRALKAGLTCRIIPSNLFIHPIHYHDFLYNPRKSFLLDWELCRVFVKYNYHVRRDHLYNFFIQPWSLKRLPNMYFRVFGTFVYIVKNLLLVGDDSYR